MKETIGFGLAAMILICLAPARTSFAQAPVTPPPPTPGNVAKPEQTEEVAPPAGVISPTVPQQAPAAVPATEASPQPPANNVPPPIPASDVPAPISTEEVPAPPGATVQPTKAEPEPAPAAAGEPVGQPPIPAPTVPQPVPPTPAPVVVPQKAAPAKSAPVGVQSKATPQASPPLPSKTRPQAVAPTKVAPSKTLPRRKVSPTGQAIPSGQVRVGMVKVIVTRQDGTTYEILGPPPPQGTIVVEKRVGLLGRRVKLVAVLVNAARRPQINPATGRTVQVPTVRDEAAPPPPPAPNPGFNSVRVSKDVEPEYENADVPTFGAGFR